MSTIFRTVRASSWTQRLLALVLGVNVILILSGIHVVPDIVSTPDGIGTTLAAVLIQVVIGILAFFGPFSFRRYPSSIGVAMVLGALFAIAYDGILLTQLFPSLNPNFNVFLLFLGAASLAGLIAGYQTRRFGEGVIVAMWALVIGTAIWSLGWMVISYAFWGTHQWYFFWQNDGAIDEFHSKGSTNLPLFLLQDMQGALFFHPLLSAVVGALCGVIMSGAAQGVRWLQRLVRGEKLSQADSA